MKPFVAVLGPLAAVFAFVAAPAPARAHCDTMDGPVVEEARAALAAGDVTPVLKWVGAESEALVRSAFQQTLAVRALGPEAKELADRYFFETVVRIHRQGEGEPYTGLKRAGSPVAPVIVAADRALDTSSVDELAHLLGETTEQGLRDRFARALAARQHAA
jgi:hypothetical protein